MELRGGRSSNRRRSHPRFSEEKPSVVLLDIDLPDGSGLDVLDEIKRENPETIVIVITGNVSVPTVQNPRPKRTPKASLNE